MRSHEAPQKDAASRAFTLVEVIIALAILAIAVVALLRLELISIRMTDRADTLARAALLAQARMAETLGGKYPEIGSESGAEKHVGGAALRWRVDVREAQVEELRAAQVGDMRTVDVLVTWNRGGPHERVRLTTHVAELWKR